LADLDGGKGVKTGTVVTESHLRNMLGACCDPVSGRPVGRVPNAGARVPPVAGFDLTFSPSKSVSTVWALADEATKAVIYDCHLQAIAYVLGYAERQVLHSRSGTNGVVEEDVSGAIAAAFTHWDSRAGDPQLHDHLIVWNRARSVSDGKWRTLDSRGLYKARSALSAMHQGVLSDYLTLALGVGWEGRARRHSAQPRWEITGVPEALLREFSQRVEAVEGETDRLIAEFRRAHGRSPTGVETIRMRQQATLATLDHVVGDKPKIFWGAWYIWRLRLADRPLIATVAVSTWPTPWSPAMTCSAMLSPGCSRTAVQSGR
jgi:conjugative relaxase-like TrwC/TraI family protein